MQADNFMAGLYYCIFLHKHEERNDTQGLISSNLMSEDKCHHTEESSHTQSAYFHFLVY